MSRAAAAGTSRKKADPTEPAAAGTDAAAAAENAAPETVKPNLGPKPTRGRLIDFTPDQQDEPTITALVTAVDGNTMNLHGFHPVYGGGNYFVQDIDATQRAEAGERGTWNWPVRS
jgi:hypothetical protein